MKKIRYFLEFVFLGLLLALFRILAPETASNLGGWIGRTVGPRLAASRKALNHLRAAFPDFSEERAHAVISGMWDNLGRVIAEYPHLTRLARENTSIEHIEKLDVLHNSKNGGVLFSGHLANWEIMGPALFFQARLPIGLVYRAPNNPGAAALLERARSLNGTLKTFSKSLFGIRKLVQHLRDGGFAGILIDQKYNEGLPALFFGRPAMTSPAFVQMGQKYNCPIVPFQIIRTNGAHFRLIVHDPLPVFDGNGAPRPIEDVIAQAHALLEDWITRNPEQWLWLHRRWVKS